MKKTSMKIEGMSCSACANRIERVVNKLDGVEKGSVNFAAETLALEYNEEKVKLDEVEAAIEKAGQEVEVVSLMKQTLLELEDKIEEANLMIRSNFPGHKLILMLDSERMFRVFDNLILNMTKYAMPHTRAYIDIVDLEQSVQIIFRNMSANEINVDVDELTERFVRGDQSRHTEGSGLGLAIAKSFVELQGGTFNIHIDGDLFKVILTFNK